MFSFSTHTQMSDRFLNKIPFFNKKGHGETPLCEQSLNLLNTYISIALYAQMQPYNSIPVFLSPKLLFLQL